MGLYIIRTNLQLEPDCFLRPDVVSFCRFSETIPKDVLWIFKEHVLEWGKENQGWTPGLVCRRGLMTNEPTGPNRPLMGTQREPTDPCGQAHRSRGSPRNKRRNPPEVSGFPTPQRSRRCHGIVVPKKMQKRSGKEWKRDYFSTTS